ncbi:MAG: DUF2142 domain-containing protein [Parvularculaceae bacterium]
MDVALASRNVIYARAIGLARAIIAPHRLYLAIAGVFGVAFLIVTPPGGGPDEVARFEAVYETAVGRPAGADGMPSGLAAFTEKTLNLAFSRRPYEASDVAELNAYELNASTLAEYDNKGQRILRVHNPLASAPYLPAMWLGLALELRPATIFFICKLTTLVLGLLTMTAAIRIAPARNEALAAVALWPTPVFMLGTANFDAILIGSAFLFCALIARSAAQPTRRLGRKEILLIAALGASLGIMKTPYALVPLLAVFLPSRAFGSLRARWASIAAIVLPGAAIAVAWALFVRTSIVGDAVYVGSTGWTIAPAAQFRGVIDNPLGFLGVLANTFNDPSGLAKTIASAVGWLGWNRVMLPAWVYGVALVGVALIVFNTKNGPARLVRRDAVLAQCAVGGLFTLGSLALLYLQFTPVGHDRVLGFQGRYLVPLAPLLLAWPPGRMTLLPTRAGRAALIAGVALVCLPVSVLEVAAAYHAPVAAALGRSAG